MWLITEHARYTANAGEGVRRESGGGRERNRERREILPVPLLGSSLAGMGFSSLP